MNANRILPAAIVGALLAIGLAVAGALIGRGVEYARVGDRSVTVRGLSERIVKADLAGPPLKFAAAGDDLQAVQAHIDADTAAVRRFLAANSQVFKTLRVVTTVSYRLR